MLKHQKFSLHILCTYTTEDIGVITGGIIMGDDVIMGLNISHMWGIMSNGFFFPHKAFHSLLCQY
jgi:hypothetical protein